MTGSSLPHLPRFSPSSSQAALHIALGDRSYPIHIGSLDWPQLASALRRPTASALVVTNETVAPLYLARLVAAVEPHFASVTVTTLPDGEVHKDWVSLQTIQDALADAGADRKTTLFALGGGVIGDLTGFAAAIWMRGVRFVQVPTTLLAQVDSSVGGKTGINMPQGKNLVGAFHQPAAVWSDLDCLRTLPAREFSAGLAEVVKYGPIADMPFFEWIEQNADALMARDPTALAIAVRRSCEIKAAVVAADEHEADVRAILNFGHTFGHAVETAMGYGTYLHGEAVAVGMVIASELSVAQWGLAPDWVPRLQALLRRLGLPVTAPRLPDRDWLHLMRGDKKSEAGAIRYVTLPALGAACLEPAPDAAALAAIHRHTQA